MALKCVADCYLAKGDGCVDLEVWLPLSGTVCLEQYCSLKWAEIDEAYNSLRVCASKAIAKPADMTKEEYVNTITSRQMSSNSCAVDYCAGN